MACHSLPPALPQLLIDSRLPLVFDLDETLLVAKSQSQLTKELRSLREARRPALQRASGDPQKAAKLAALDREEQLMQVGRRRPVGPLAHTPSRPCSSLPVAVGSPSPVAAAAPACATQCTRRLAAGRPAAAAGAGVALHPRMHLQCSPCCMTADPAL